MYSRGAPPGAGRPSIRTSPAKSSGQPRIRATATLRVQRPSRKSVRRLVYRSPSTWLRSAAVSHSPTGGNRSSARASHHVASRSPSWGSWRIPGARSTEPASVTKRGGSPGRRRGYPHGTPQAGPGLVQPDLATQVSTPRPPAPGKGISSRLGGPLLTRSSAAICPVPEPSHPARDFGPKSRGGGRLGEGVVMCDPCASNKE